MSGLSTVAWVAHDLAVAAGVGGGLFGRLALHPATEQIDDAQERGRVVSDAWRRFNGVQLGAFGVMAATWITGRAFLSGREVDETSRTLVVVKDALVAGTVITAIGASIAGRAMSGGQPETAPPLQANGQRLAPGAEARAHRAKVFVDSFGIANLVLGAGVIAVTTVLAMRSGQSGRWSVVSRWLK